MGAFKNAFSRFFVLFLVLFNFTFAFCRSGEIVVAKDGTGQYSSIQDAINAVPNNRSVHTVIFIKKGIYKEKLILPSSKKNVSLIGESVNETIITFDDYNPKIKGTDTITTWSSYTFSVDGEGFIAQNITFQNTAGMVGQAVAVIINTDKAAFYNCRFLGNQDTVFANTIGRCYFLNCYIEGTTDFIFGSAVALFDSCRIHSKANSYITAAATPKGNKYGFVFRKCKFTADTIAAQVYLGRPWRPNAKVVIINSELGKHIQPEGWKTWKSKDEETSTYYAEFQNFGSGANSAARVLWSKQLTNAELADYSMEQIFARNSVPIPVVELRSWIPSFK